MNFWAYSFVTVCALILCGQAPVPDVKWVDSSRHLFSVIVKLDSTIFAQVRCESDQTIMQEKKMVYVYIPHSLSQRFPFSACAVSLYALLCLSVCLFLSVSLSLSPCLSLSSLFQDADLDTFFIVCDPVHRDHNVSTTDLQTVIKVEIIIT